MLLRHVVLPIVLVLLFSGGCAVLDRSQCRPNALCSDAVHIRRDSYELTRDSAVVCGAVEDYPVSYRAKPVEKKAEINEPVKESGTSSEPHN